VLEAQLKGKAPKESASSSRGAHKAEPKLRTFHGTKYAGRKDEFETFTLRYEAEKDLNAGSFAGWMEAQAIAFLTTVLEGKALQVVWAYLTMHVDATYAGVWTDLTAAFRDTKQGERALVKLQGLVQKEELDDYVREFNLLQGLTSKVAIIDKEALLRYFVQGLHLNIWIGLAAALSDNLQVAQIAARAINLFVVGKKNNL
jgi:Retrotransposon gag protein